MKLLPDLQFHEDAHLLIYRPRGLMSEESVNKVVSVIEDLEAKVQEPFNRFFDTLGHDEVELNFRYVIQLSLHRRLSYAGRPPIKSAILATDSTIVHYAKLKVLSMPAITLDFSGKVTLVTGGSRGIGRATALLFAQSGAKVVIGDIDPAGSETVEKIKRGEGEATF